MRYSRFSTMLRFVLLALWICVIWGHSLMEGSISSKESMAVVVALRKLSIWLGDTDFSFLRRVMLHFGIADFARLDYFVRKCAHFGEHVILAILMTRALRTQVRNPLGVLLLAAMLCSVVPFVDELVIQTHVADRAGSLADVYLDLYGVATGLVLALPGSLIASTRPERAPAS
jgi:VanZ family protein